MSMRIFLAMTSLCMLHSTASAETTQPNRSTTTTLTYTDPTFADANARYENTLSFQATAASSRGQFWQFLAAYENLDVSISGDASLTFPPPAPDPNTGVIESFYTVEFTEAGTADVFIAYDTRATTTPLPNGESFIANGVMDIDGTLYYVLNFAGGGTRGFDEGGAFVSEVIMQGEWTPGSMTTGGAMVAFNDAFYTATDFFTYDPSTDATLLSVEGSGLPVDQWPNISLTLIGAEVPEPGALLPLVIAALHLRRR